MDRLREVLQRDDGGLSLRTDPTALAPECLLVFEAKGPVVNMARAVNGIAGLELVDEEEWAGEKGETSVAYLMVPDQRALGNILSLWDRWQSGRDLGSGNAPWRDLFKLLKDLRRWGPNDRLDTSDHSGLQVIADRLSDDEDMAGIEIELVYSNTERASAFSQYVSTYIYKCGGSILSRKRIEEINYDGILALVTGRELKLILKHSQDTLATAEEIRHIRPQSQAASVTKEDAKVEIVDAGAAQIGLPILAMIDGATVAGHPLLADRTRVEDVFDLDTAAATPVENRQHGTAMASLIVHGDLNDPNRLPLPRQICTVPAMRWNGYEEELPANRLIIDLVYQAVLHLRGLTDADILIINLSLGNTRRPFHGRMSPWARLLDWLACEYGILFIVSAGNKEESFPVSAYTTRTALEDANPGERAKNLLAAVDAVKAERRLIAPAETLNGVTVGALNHDWVPTSERRGLTSTFEAYPDLPMAIPSSRLGPGFANAVKPDILLPGGREHLTPATPGGSIGVSLAKMSRFFGLKVAAPPRPGGDPNATGASGNTSGATALASRTAHRIHDALEDAYGEQFLALPRRHRALILKALLVHPARWDPAVEAFIKNVVGPAEGRYHEEQKNNVRRYLGYGAVDGDTAVACAADRATFWATGTIGREQSMRVDVPIPACIGGKAQPHSLAATLAWFSPVKPGRQIYRAARLKLLEPDGLGKLGVTSANTPQPNQNQNRRGTTISRWWAGSKAPVVGADMTIPIILQREPDQPGFEDEDISFGLAVTLEMPGVIEVYEQVRQRLGLRLPIRS